MLAALPPVAVPRPAARVRPLPAAIGALAAATALLGFTALTVLAYFALIQGHFDALGFADKLIEGLLIALLVVEDRRAR